MAAFFIGLAGKALMSYSFQPLPFLPQHPPVRMLDKTF